MRDSIPARLLIDPADLAALRGAGTSPEVCATLHRLSKLMEDVRARLANDSRILIDQNAAAELMGCSAKSLQNWNVPAVRLGSRILYRPETLRAWAAEREAGELVEGAR